VFVSYINIGITHISRKQYWPNATALNKRQNGKKLRLFNNERTFPIVSPRMPLRFILCTCLQISWACTQNID